MTPLDLRGTFIKSLTHASVVLTRLRSQSGKSKPFNFADAHKLSEGLFLSAWNDWEAFVRSLLICDLAQDQKGSVCVDVKKFRVKGGPYRLAEALLRHPDHPGRFVEWDYDMVKSRADVFLSAPHRFTPAMPRQADLAHIKRMRNAIAHSSDKARSSFLSLVKHPPFSLTAGQTRGLSVGLFLYCHKWSGQFVLEECFTVLQANAMHLVP